MIIKATNKHLSANDILNALMLEGRHYIEMDGIRLVVDDHEVVGWYNPNGPTECSCNVPSEEVSA